jgi:hypothetical protein
MSLAVTTALHHAYVGDTATGGRPSHRHHTLESDAFDSTTIKNASLRILRIDQLKGLQSRRKSARVCKSVHLTFLFGSTVAVSSAFHSRRNVGWSYRGSTLSKTRSMTFKPIDGRTTGCKVFSFSPSRTEMARRQLTEHPEAAIAGPALIF